jgi:EAL domain-containing protein (putative c-di-GMP-specific phosphodiesterase class I)
MNTRASGHMVSVATVSTPLDLAVEERDRDVLKTVERAVENRQVRLAFQPVVSASDPGKPAFFEGLARVLDHKGRTVPARDFIDAVETHEVGRALDCVALELGLKALREYPQLKLSINMSARSIGYRRWVQTLERGLASGTPLSGRLILEITEASAMVMPDVVQSFMLGLQSQGITFALDDFGAGYTSFRYLKSFYFDMLKIDGQFIRGIDTEPDNQVLVEALVGIGRQFGMFTVAEMVESEAEARFLSAAGLDLLQGYLYGAPGLKPEFADPPAAETATVGA